MALMQNTPETNRDVRIAFALDNGGVTRDIVPADPTDALAQLDAMIGKDIVVRFAVSSSSWVVVGSLDRSTFDNPADPVEDRAFNIVDNAGGCFGFTASQVQSLTVPA